MRLKAPIRMGINALLKEKSLNCPKYIPKSVDDLLAIKRRADTYCKLHRDIYRFSQELPQFSLIEIRDNGYILGKKHYSPHEIDELIEYVNTYYREGIL